MQWICLCSFLERARGNMKAKERISMRCCAVWRSIILISVLVSWVLLVVVAATILNAFSIINNNIQTLLALAEAILFCFISSKISVLAAVEKIANEQAPMLFFSYCKLCSLFAFFYYENFLNDPFYFSSL